MPGTSPGMTKKGRSAVEKLPQNLVHRLAVLLRGRLALGWRRGRLRRGLRRGGCGLLRAGGGNAAALALAGGGRAGLRGWCRSGRRGVQAAEPLLQQIADGLAQIAAELPRLPAALLPAALLAAGAGLCAAQQSA